ncbi:hypothetical protein D3C83_307970 [compost metagenome]
MSAAEVREKFDRLTAAVASPARAAELARTIEGLWAAPDVRGYAALMGAVPDPR